MLIPVITGCYNRYDYVLLQRDKGQKNR